MEIISTETRAVRELPTGVQKIGQKYKATYGRKYLGVFATVVLAAAAIAAEKVARIQERWQHHLDKDITRDADNKAVIQLTGKNGAGKFTRVPEKLWHQLTFEHMWN